MTPLPEELPSSAGTDATASVEAPPPVRIVVGLGNPGTRYEKTRHNIGFEAVCALLESRSFRPRHFDGGVLVDATIRGRDISLLRPTGYMNRSGGPVRRLLEGSNFSPQEVLVVCDDFALPLGAIRTRRRGSDGGHNGLASILSALGTSEVPRMRLGVGGPPGDEDPADFVLDPFDESEHETVEDLLNRSAEAIETAIGDGIEVAMNRFNRTQV